MIASYRPLVVHPLRDATKLSLKECSALKTFDERVLFAFMLVHHRREEGGGRREEGGTKHEPTHALGYYPV
jgi:hypothetical protein